MTLQSGQTIDLDSQNDRRRSFLRAYFLRYFLYALVPSIVLGVIGGLGVGEIVWQLCSEPCSYAGLLLRMPGFLWGSVFPIVIIHVLFVRREKINIPNEFSVGTLWLTWSIAFLIWIYLNQFSDRIILTFFDWIL